MFSAWYDSMILDEIVCVCVTYYVYVLVKELLQMLYVQNVQSAWCMAEIKH